MGNWSCPIRVQPRDILLVISMIHVHRKFLKMKPAHSFRGEHTSTATVSDDCLFTSTTTTKKSCFGWPPRSGSKLICQNMDEHYFVLWPQPGAIWFSVYLFPTSLDPFRMVSTRCLIWSGFFMPKFMQVSTIVRPYSWTQRRNSGDMLSTRSIRLLRRSSARASCSSWFKC